MQSNEEKVLTKASKSSFKKTKSDSKLTTTQNKDAGSDDDKKVKEQVNFAALLRSLYHNILRITEDQDNRHLWQNGKRNGLYKILNFNDLDLVDTFVKEIGWRF